METKPHLTPGALQSEASPFDTLLERQHDPKSHGDAPMKATDSSSAQKPVDGIVVGQLVGLSEDGQMLVQFPGNPGSHPVGALAATRVSKKDMGRPVALAFVEGNIRQPLILGFVQASATENGQSNTPIVEVQQDEKRLTISAENELLLKCGDSSITLTKAGKILLRGKYLSSRSSGVNRIKGGSVQIN